MGREALSPAATSPVPSSSGADGSLAGLLGVLDRADAMLPRQHRSRQPYRPGQAQRPWRSAATRASRGVALRPVPPLRSSVPAPAPAPADPPAPPPPAVAVAAPPHRRRLRGLARRAALWGAGPDGENLAWNRSSAAAQPPAPAGRRGGLRRLPRRLALWGAGPDGAHLASWSPTRPAPARVISLAP